MYSLLSAFGDKERRGWVDNFQDLSLPGYLLLLTAEGAMFVIMGMPGMPGKLTGAMPSELRAEYYSLLDHRGDLMKI